MINVNHKFFLEDMERIYSSRNDWEKFDNQKILITGANGMLASYLVFYLIWLREKKRINSVIILNVRNYERCLEIYGRYISEHWFNVIVSDVCDLDFHNSKLLDVEYIIHAASFASANYFGIYPVETILPNTIATNKILDFYKNKKVKGMVYFSSTSVYGGEKSKVYVENDPSCIDLSSSGNFYGISKYCGEAICKAYANEYGFPVVSVRIAHSYGPTMNLNTDVRVFSEFIKNIVDGKDIQVKSDGKESRLFCYASDCIAGVMTALLAGKKGESYNLGNPQEEYSISALAELLVKLFPEKKLNVIYLKRNDKKYTPSTFYSSSTINVEKLQKLGWRIYVDVKNGFKRTVDIMCDQ